MESIISMFKIPVKFIEKPNIEKPYWIVEVPTEEHIKMIASRSVLIKNCIELWSRAKTADQLHLNLKNALLNTTDKWKMPENSEKCSDGHVCPSSIITSNISPNKSFKVEVETFCKHFTMKEKVAKIEVRFYYYLILKPCVTPFIRK